MSQATNQSGRIAGAGERHRLGARVARLIAGAWRDNPPSTLDLSETELHEITPLLCQTGAAALAWSRIEQTPLADTASGRELHEVYRQSRLTSLIREREIVYVLSLLRDEGIEPVLVKGWAMARRYPDRALRPSGDIDLCVRPDQFARATAALKCLESIDGHYVDLHAGFSVGKPQPTIVQSPTSNVQRQNSKIRTGSSSDGVSDAQSSMSKLKAQPSPRRHWTLDIGHWTTLYERSQLVSLNGTPVRVLSDEDHLRILCAHLFRSGARRPAWLCDVALFVESEMSKVQSQRPKTEDQRPFNWEVCVGTDPTAVNWIVSAIGLARDLLDANIDHTPFAKVELPRWLSPAVLQQWGGRVKSPVQSPTSKSQVQSPTSKVQSQDSARRHWTLDIGHWTDLYSRWDNPIRSVAAVGGEFNNWPRLPYRVAESIKRAWPLATDQ